MSTGVGRVLVAVYAILAIAATGRSIFQIIERFDEAPIAFTLSALSAVVYIVATLALALGWDRVAWVTICFELVGVLVIGTLSMVAPGLLGLDGLDPFGRRRPCGAPSAPATSSSRSSCRCSVCCGCAAAALAGGGMT